MTEHCCCPFRLVAFLFLSLRAVLITMSLVPVVTSWSALKATSPPLSGGFHRGVVLEVTVPVTAPRRPLVGSQIAAGAGGDGSAFPPALLTAIKCRPCWW